MDELTWDDVPQFMDELRAVARALLAREGTAQSVMPTELVNAALQRQKRTDQDWGEVTWANRAYFFGAMHRAMRRTLNDRHDARNTQKARRLRGVMPEHLDLENLPQMLQTVPDAVAALGPALEALRTEDEKLADAVELRYLSGLTLDETARTMGVSVSTVQRMWLQARAWLAAKILKLLEEEGGGGEAP